MKDGNKLCLWFCANQSSQNPGLNMFTLIDRVEGDIPFRCT